MWRGDIDLDIWVHRIKGRAKKRSSRRALWSPTVDWSPQRPDWLPAGTQCRFIEAPSVDWSTHPIINWLLLRWRGGEGWRIFTLYVSLTYPSWQRSHQYHVYTAGKREAPEQTQINWQTDKLSLTTKTERQTDFGSSSYRAGKEKSASHLSLQSSQANDADHWYIYICVFMYTYIYMHMRIYIYIYVYQWSASLAWDDGA